MEIERVRVDGEQHANNLTPCTARGMSREWVDRARVNDGFFIRFCSTQIAEIPHTLREELAVDLIDNAG